MKQITLPLSPQIIQELKAGDVVALSGVVYTARDAAHKRIVEQVDTPPFALENACIYYCGPTPPRAGEIIGSCGPTTSARMDDYTPALLSRGVKAFIGKGKRNDEVNRLLARYGAVYFVAVGGAAALIKSRVEKCELIAYPDLGCEAVYRLQIKSLPLVVATDGRGQTILK